MPIYEYETIEPTPVRFEVLQSLQDKPLTVHPTTGKPVRKVFSCCAISGSTKQKQPHARGCSCCN